MGQHLAAWVVIAVAVVIMVYDTWVSQQRPDFPTISEYIRTTALRYPMVPFFLGMLADHLFRNGVRH